MGMNWMEMKWFGLGLDMEGPMSKNWKRKKRDIRERKGKSWMEIEGFGLGQQMKGQSL